MRHFYRNAALVLIALAIFVWALYPPARKLRLGKDLRGGVTLVYSVMTDRTGDKKDMIAKTIEVLKDRVDPNGFYEIQMVQQGQDRIEISMPLPGPHVKEYRQAFEGEIAQLESQALDADALERALRIEGEVRATALAGLAADDTRRLELLTQAAAALDESRAARVVLAQAEKQGLDDDILNDLAGKAAQAEIDSEAARDEALASSLSPDKMRRTLGLSKTTKMIEGDDGVWFALPSQYERAMDRLKENHPDLVGQIDAIVTSYDAYMENRDSLDDPADLKRMLAGAGVLSFRISVDAQASSGPVVPHGDEQRLREELHEKGPRNVTARDARWYKINRIDNFYDSVAQFEALDANPGGYFAGRMGYVVERYQGEFYMLCWDTRDKRLTQNDGQWGLESSHRSTDQLGKPAIGFAMDSRGASKLGGLTDPNQGNNMAVLLDDQVYTAPNLLSRISRSGQITGDYSEEELSYVIRVLNAGSLQARLGTEPLSEITVAPELGADNLRSGLNAGIVALIVVSVFMIFYYFGYGMVAVFSLCCNAVLILGAMSLARAPFTLPGIAGVILTFGMAVDANVLIYERVREELRKGQDLRVAVKLGFERAMSSIVDGNVTNLIVCFVLAYTGTQEIKGFAITLGIGVVATLFSALVVSRLIFTGLVEHIKITKLSMLPMAVPLLEKILHPKIDWIKLRFVTLFISIAFVGTGIAMIVIQGEKMLDTEFRGGSAVTVTFRPADENDPTGRRLTATRAEVEDAIHAIADGLDDTDPLQPLRNAEILPVNPQADGVTSGEFQIKTYAANTDAVLGAVVNALREKIDALPGLAFRGSESERAGGAPIYPIASRQLGDNINRADVRNDVTEFIGGVAILLENISPPPTLAQLESRLAQMRSKPDFSDTLQRTHQVVVLGGSPDAVTSACVLVRDESLSFFDNEEAWRADVSGREWKLVRSALTEPTTLASVQRFSAVIAEGFRAQAVVAVGLSFLLILIYIWVRFGSVRYSLAAIVALVHDVLAVIGLIALAEIIYDSPAFAGIAAALGIEPFKMDLNLVAALLTVVGYSLNDTIIILDRIRENRGRLPYASADIINKSINETISRTVITSGTTMLAVLILYINGGAGVHAFSYALLMGVIIGTYSSVAVAAPLVWSRKKSLSHATH